VTATRRTARSRRPAPPAFPAAARRLSEIGRRFYERGWMSGTSGNLSAVVSHAPLRLAITASSVPKGGLTPKQILQVDARGVPTRPASGRPSAETPLHCIIARERGAGAILHTHSVWSTILSDIHAGAGGLAISGYEMQKGLAGIRTHEQREFIPILENDQDMARLAERVSDVLTHSPDAHALLLRRHGLYTWGATIDDALRHVEILEFLFEVLGRRGPT
jgi:methylthioribulose-1-phosphate dehydratase